MLFVVLKQNTNLFNFIGETARQGVEEQADGEDDKQETEITEEDLEVGRNGYISSAQIIERATGTGPWDDDDEPGNDSSPDNDIVRSFDQVTWTVNLTTALKEGAQQASYTGGVVEFTASLPVEYAKTEFAPYMEWDLDSMGWIEDANLSDDGITLTGKYSLSETETTLPGAQTLVFVLKLYGVGNNSEFAPTFTFNLAGNEENEKQTLIDNTITVSATGKYNIQLYDATSGLSNKATVDYGLGETSGRMYGYAFTVQLYNDNESKGLKGVELSEGTISFDIEMQLQRSENGSTETEDITQDAMPVLWNYNYNHYDDPGKIEGREMYGSYHQKNCSLPKGINDGDRSYTTYNSGDISIIQEENILHVTIENYGFDEDFPKYSASATGTPNRSPIYTDNIGTFSVAYMQIFVPDTEASTQENKNYYFHIEDVNLSVPTLSGQKIVNQENNTDDSFTKNHIVSSKGAKDFFIDYDGPSSIAYWPGNRGRDGNTALAKSQELNVALSTSVSSVTDPEYYIYSENIIYKFDGEGLEPAGDEITYSLITGQSLKFNAYYLTKKDGTNWVSQEEMNKTIDLDDFNVYKHKKDIPENYVCVGLFFESIDGGVWEPIYGIVNVRMTVKETAETNKTYGMTFATRVWTESNKLDRNIYTVENKEISYDEYPEPTWKKEGRSYIKTEYDENGQIIAGTHSGSYGYGNSILVVA